MEITWWPRPRPRPRDRDACSIGQEVVGCVRFTNGWCALVFGCSPCSRYGDGCCPCSWHGEDLPRRPWRKCTVSLSTMFASISVKATFPWNVKDTLSRCWTEPTSKNNQFCLFVFVVMMEWESFQPVEPRSDEAHRPDAGLHITRTTIETVRSCY